MGNGLASELLFSATSRVHASGCCSLHAEYIAISMMTNSGRFGTCSSRKKRKMYDMVVYRPLGGISRPCVSCALLIRECGFIKNVYYSDGEEMVKVKAHEVCEDAVMLRAQTNQNNMIKKTFHTKRAIYV